MNALLIATGQVALIILGMLQFGLIIWIVMGLLYQFGVLNRGSDPVRIVYDTLGRIFEPILTPIRRALPDLGPIDLSPIVVFLVIIFLSEFIRASLPVAV